MEWSQQSPFVMDSKGGNRFARTMPNACLLEILVSLTPWLLCSLSRLSKFALLNVVLFGDFLSNPGRRTLSKVSNSSVFNFDQLLSIFFEFIINFRINGNIYSHGVHLHTARHGPAFAEPQRKGAYISTGACLKTPDPRKRAPGNRGSSSCTGIAAPVPAGVRLCRKGSET